MGAISDIMATMGKGMPMLRLLLSLVVVDMDMVTMNTTIFFMTLAILDIMVTMGKGMPMLRLLLFPMQEGTRTDTTTMGIMDMDMDMAMAIMGMGIMAIMERGRQMLEDTRTGITMDTIMDITMAIMDMVMDTMDTTVKDFCMAMLPVITRT